MKNIISGLLSVAVLGVATQVYAGEFNFVSTTTPGIDATFWVNTDDGTATAGSMVITGVGPDNGTWNLVDLGPIAAGQYVNVDGYYIDNWFDVTPSPALQLDPYGLLFVNSSGQFLNISSGYQAGYAGSVPVVAVYGLYDNIAVGGTGNCSLPDGGLTASMLGMALIGVGCVRRMVK